MAPNATSLHSPTVTDQSQVTDQAKVDSKTAASGKMQNETIEPGNQDLWTTKNNSGTADQHLPNVSFGDEEQNANRTTEAEAPKLNEETVKQYTHDVYEAVNGDEPDNEKISHLLESLNAADRKAVEEAYTNTSGNTDHRDLRTELKDNLGDDDFRKVEATLNQRDGRTNDAGNLMVSLSAIDDDRDDAERRVLETFSTLNAEQQQQLKADFQNDYGKSVDQVIEEFGLSDDAKKAVGFLSKPVEQRTAQDIEEFAKFAIGKKDLDYFGIALRGDSPAAVEAREKLSNDEDFKKQIAEAFKVHQDGGNTGLLKNFASMIPGGEVLVGGVNLVEGLVKGDLNFDRLTEGTSIDKWKKAIESKEVDSKLLQAMDILKNGQVSLATIASDNTGSIFGWFDNKDAISNAAEHATENERKLFSRGQELAQGGGQPQSEEDKNALDFYNNIHAAFGKAGNDSEPLKWEDRLVNGKDGSIISQLADNNSKEGRYTAVESLSQKDWEKLKDPQQGAAFRKQIETYLADHGGDQEAQAVLKLLDQKLAAGTYEDSSKIMRSISDLVTTSPHSKTAVASIAALSPQEAAKYQSDSSFRAQVDQFLKDKLDDLGQVACTKLLSQIATTGKPPEQDAIDKLFSAKLNESEGKDAIGNIEEVLKDPVLRQKLAGPESGLNDVEKQLKKTIEGYIDASTPDAPAAYYGRGSAPNGSEVSDEQKDNEYLQTLYQNGRLTVDQKSKLNLRGENFLSEAATVSPEERQKLYDSGLISPEEKQLVETLTRQSGEMSLADKLRGAVIKDGTDAELFEDELKGLSPEDKQKLKEEYAQKYGSALDEDVLAHVSDEAKNNFRTYLTAGGVDGRQDFYDNLEAALYSESGYSPDGSQEVMERALATQGAMLSDFQARFEKLPPEKQAEANQLFTEALNDYQESKEKCAEKLYQAAVIVGGVAVGVATGGVGLIALASVVAIGAAGRVALKKAIQGNDYELSLSNVLKDGAIGGATAGLSVLGPETFAAFAQVGKVAAGRFATAAGQQLEKTVVQQAGQQAGKDLLQTVLKNDGMANLEKELNKVVSHSIVRGEPITEQTLNNVVGKIITASATPQQRSALSSALRTTLETSGREISEGVVKSSLSGMARQSTAYGMLGGTTNVAIESSVGLANGHFDPRALPASFALGFGVGAGFSAGLESALRSANKFSTGRATEQPSASAEHGVPTYENPQVRSDFIETSSTRLPETTLESRGMFTLPSGRSMDAITATSMRSLGLTPDSYVYRVMNPKYLDFQAGTVPPNPNSMALVVDPYNKIDLFRGKEPTPMMVPSRRNASEVGPGLNVAVSDPSAYWSEGQVLIGIRMGDVLETGGRVYRDDGAAVMGITPLYVTFDQPVPFSIIPRNASGEAPVANFNNFVSDGPSRSDIVESIKTENLLGEGYSNKVYSVDGSDDFVVRIPKIKDPQASMQAHFTPVADFWPSRNLGQPIARLGDIEVLKKVQGRAIEAGPADAGLRQRVRNMIARENPQAKHARQERIIAAMPQAAYDDLAKTMLGLIQRGKHFDAVNPGNVLINNKGFSLVDIGDRPILQGQGMIDSRSAGVGLYEMLRPLTGTGVDNWVPNSSKNLQKSYQAIIEKAVAAAQRTGMQIVPDPRLYQMFKVAGIPERYAQLVAGRPVDQGLDRILRQTYFSRSA